MFSKLFPWIKIHDVMIFKWKICGIWVDYVFSIITCVFHMRMKMSACMIWKWLLTCYLHAGKWVEKRENKIRIYGKLCVMIKWYVTWHEYNGLVMSDAIRKNMCAKVWLVIVYQMVLRIHLHGLTYTCMALIGLVNYDMCTLWLKWL